MDPAKITTDIASAASSEQTLAADLQAVEADDAAVGVSLSAANATIAVDITNLATVKSLLAAATSTVSAANAQHATDQATIAVLQNTVAALQLQIAKLTGIVADPAGIDTNPGTAQSPVKSISRAIALAGVNGAVLVNPGAYSESVKTLDGQIIHAAGAVLDGKNALARLLEITNRCSVFGFYCTNAKCTTTSSQAGFAAVLVSGSGNTITDIEASGNGDTGIDVHGTATAYADSNTLIRPITNKNGRQGVKSGFASNLTLQNWTSVGNNPNHVFSGGNEAGAGKFSDSNIVSILAPTINLNNGYGPWADVRTTFFRIQGGSITNQSWPAPAAYFGAGAMLEISSNCTIDGVTFSGNSGGAIGIGEADHVSIKNCVFGAGTQYVSLRDFNNRAPHRISVIDISNNHFAAGSFICTDGSANQYPWTDDQFGAKKITGTGNTFAGSPVAYIGSGANRTVTDGATLTKRTGIS